MTAPFKPSIGAPAENQSPLIKFRGVLKEYKAETRKFGERDATIISFNFTDVEVLEAREPYPFPIATITVGYSERADTRWSALTKSFRVVLPSPDIDLLVGKQQEWYFTGGNSTRRLVSETDAEGNTTEVWKSLPTDCWQLTWIEGVGGANGAGNLMDMIVDNADGKMNDAFYQWFYSDPTLRNLAGYQDAVTAAANRQLLETLQTGGKLTRSAEGVWQKVV